MKTWLILFAVLGLAGLVLLGSHGREPVILESSHGPWFEVQVVKPRSARPLFGLLPKELEAWLLDGEELRFDDASLGAGIGRVRPDRLELRADGWELVVETDGQGRVVSGTRLVFPLMLANKQRRLRCRPGARAAGSYRAFTREGSGELDGRFRIELATCENLETGRQIEWPPAPLTVHGSFARLPGAAD